MISEKAGKIRNFIWQNRYLLLILMIGLVVRLLFLLIYAEPFFCRKSLYEDRDTLAWATAFENLFHHGVFTVNPGNEWGYFGRMPLYSFFMGFFWLLSGQNWLTAYVMIAWVQVMLDILSIFLLYKTAQNLFQGKKLVHYTVALLYATYPFIIVWNPVVYSESLSIFLLITSLYYFTKSQGFMDLFLSGLFLGLSALTRPQMLILFPFLFLAVLYSHRLDFKILMRKGLIFGFAFLLSFGAWPARNVFYHHKLVLTQDLRGFDNWNIDVLSFLQYIYAVKAGWEPQCSRIIANETVTFPAAAYKVKGDSAKLALAVNLAKTCGSGFSYKVGYPRQPFNQPNCNLEIQKLFTELRESQIKNNPWNFYVLVPAQNLGKALFKRNLVDESATARSKASLLLNYRTLLIFLGIIGLVLMFYGGPNERLFALILLLFFVSLYLVLCAGPWVQCRNIEMRYFLPADVLLLLPAGGFFQWLSDFRAKGS